MRNLFSPLPTSLDAYNEMVCLRAGEYPTDAPRMCTAPLFVARQRAAVEGFTLIAGSCFAASPAGTTNRADYEFMRDEVLAQLKAGCRSMVCCLDCEVRRARLRHRRGTRSALPPYDEAWVVP